jgi:hypothetical protein
MAGDKDTVAKSNILDVEFGGSGPRQALGAAMKDADYIRATLVVSIGNDGEVVIYQSEMDAKDLALIGMKVQGYAIGAVNGWLEEEE